MELETTFDNSIENLFQINKRNLAIWNFFSAFPKEIKQPNF